MSNDTKITTEWTEIIKKTRLKIVRGTESSAIKNYDKVRKKFVTISKKVRYFQVV